MGHARAGHFGHQHGILPGIGDRDSFGGLGRGGGKLALSPPQRPSSPRGLSLHENTDSTMLWHGSKTAFYHGAGICASFNSESMTLAGMLLFHTITYYTLPFFPLRFLPLYSFAF